MSNVTVLNEARAPMTSGGQVMAIVPQSYDDVWRIASAICKAGMAPKGLDTVEKASIAIMQGMEVGMKPLQALQRIAVVNGRPTIWGDGAIGLVRGSGLCDYVKERIEGKGDDRVAICEAKRRGESDPIIRSFSVNDAKKAGLWNKGGPWTQYPERMLQMRARAFALRDLFADVLGGMYLPEEIEDARGDDYAPQVQAEPAKLRVAPPPPPPVDDVPSHMADDVDQADMVTWDEETGEIEDTSAIEDRIRSEALESAHEGMASLEKWFKGLTKPEKQFAKPIVDQLKATAQQADGRRANVVDDDLLAAG